MPARIPRFSQLDGRAAGIHGTDGPFPLAKGALANAKGVSVDAERVSVNAKGALVNAEGVSVDAERVSVNVKGALVNAKGVSMDHDVLSMNGHEAPRSSPKAPPISGWNRPWDSSIGTAHHAKTHLRPKVVLCGTVPTLLGASLMCDVARAQWTVTNLIPQAGSEGWILAQGEGHQGGAVTSPAAAEHASIWNGSASSWVDLHPAGASRSLVRGVGGNQQVGLFDPSSISPSHAALWRGTAASVVDLHPANAYESIAYATDGTYQFGLATIRSVTFTYDHASRWSSTADSWVDLNPSGVLSSAIYAGRRGQQVGYTYTNGPGGGRHATVWYGTADSWVDLHPVGSLESGALGTGGDQQVGYVSGSRPVSAALWRGTAASWVDLRPAGSTASFAFGASHGRQVGIVQFERDGFNRACVWSGTAASFVDLSVFAAPAYRYTEARCIWGDAHTLYVGGFGLDANSNNAPLLWSRPLCIADMDNGSGLGNPDEGVTIDDLLYYLGQYAASSSRADVDDGSGTGTPDGGVTIDDLLYYLQRFEAGC